MLTFLINTKQLKFTDSNQLEELDLARYDIKEIIFYFIPNVKT